MKKTIIGNFVTRFLLFIFILFPIFSPIYGKTQENFVETSLLLSEAKNQHWRTHHKENHTQNLEHSLLKEHDQKLFLATMAKSGSFMINKLWYMLTGDYYIFFFGTRELPFLEEGQYSFTHFQIVPSLLEEQLASEDTITLVNIRDPRDVCVSLVNFIRNHDDILAYPKFRRAQFLKLSFDEQLESIIRGRNSLCPICYLSQLLKTVQDPRSLVCRYEHLVGPEGGGDAELQRQQILTITNSFGIELSSDELEYVANNLYGKRLISGPAFNWTFESGKIGSWKEAFNEKHKRLFKQLMGNALIELGYEQDNDW